MATDVLAEIDKYTAALAADPKSRAFAPLAEAYRKQGKLDEAIKVVTDGLKIHTNLPGALVTLARCLIAQGKFAEARPNLERAIKLAPENLTALSALGDTLEKLGDPAAAIKSFRTVLLLSPADAHAKERLAALGSTGTSPADKGRADAFQVKPAADALRPDSAAAPDPSPAAILSSSAATAALPTSPLPSAATPAGSELGAAPSAPPAGLVPAAPAAVPGVAGPAPAPPTPVIQIRSAPAPATRAPAPLGKPAGQVSKPAPSAPPNTVPVAAVPVPVSPVPRPSVPATAPPTVAAASAPEPNPAASATAPKPAGGPPKPVGAPPSAGIPPRPPPSATTVPIIAKPVTLVMGAPVRPAAPAKAPVPVPPPRAPEPARVATPKPGQLAPDSKPPEPTSPEPTLAKPLSEPTAKPEVPAPAPVLGSVLATPSPEPAKPAVVSPPPIVTPPVVTPPPSLASTTAWGDESSTSIRGPTDLAPIQTATVADLFVKQGHPDQAIAIYEKLVKEDPGNESLRKKLAEARGPRTSSSVGPVPEASIPPVDTPAESIVAPADTLTVLATALRLVEANRREPSPQPALRGGL